MNQFVPDWTSNMGDAFAPLGVEDDGLMELLWCNGHVVMQSQAPRKPPRSEKEAPAPEVQDNEAAAWFQYPVEDPLERDLFSELFGETPPADPGRACKEEAAAAAVTASQSGMMPPPKNACVEDIGGSDCAVGKADAGSEGTPTTETGGESSMLTIGSSFCGSNHVQTTPRAAPPPRGGKGGGSAHDAATATSSSMQQPRSSAAKAGATAGAGARRSGKRKQRDAAETEDVEFESASVTCEPAQKTTTTKRRRAAEVHNLSERRRRDRINEKMKALQELIPHCNKTDKASMLDEAIDYLKSLQLQLQVMWMGGGMAAAAAAAPVMFPTGMHQYMQRVVGPTHLATVPRMPPFMAPSPVQSPPVSHMPVADPYARCLAVDSLQSPGPMHYLQGMNLYQHQSPAPQQQPVVPGGSLPAATAQTLPSDSTLHEKHESLSKARSMV